MSKPRILHINTANTWRGGEQQLSYLIGELKGAVEQHVICAPHSPMAADCERQAVPYTTLRKRSGLDLFLAKGVKQLVRSHRIQLIHTHDAHGHTAAVVANRLLRMNTPIVVSRRVDFPIHSAFSKRFKYQGPHIAQIICVSRAIEDIMAENLGSRKKLCTIHSGIDTDRFASGVTGRLRQELKLPQDKLIIGNVAAHAPHKDLFTFIRTAKRLLNERTDLHFVSIGDGPLSEEIRNFAKAEGMTNELHFLGYRQDVEALLPDFDLFLMTSETEGLGTSILDAFAAKVFVVSTAAGGIPEMVVEGETGLLAPIADDAQLAVQVNKALNMDRSAIVTAASEKLKNFTKEATATKTLAVYQNLLAG